MKPALASALAGGWTGPLRPRRARVRATELSPDDHDGLFDERLQEVRHMFPLQRMGMPPLILLHQLYTDEQDRTRLDKQMDERRRKNHIRIVHVPGVEGEHCAVLFTADLAHYVQTHLITDATSADDLSVYDAFLVDVLPNHRGMDISVSALDNVLASRLGSERSRVNRAINLLMSQGFLTRYKSDTFRFAAPHAGRFVKHLHRGRQDIFGYIQRRPYSRALKRQVLERGSRRSLINAEYILSDLLGLGLLKETTTSSGILLSIVRRHD